MKEYPDLILGMAWLRLDEEPPGIVDDFYARGFSGLKLIFPRFNYDYEGYYCFYARAEAYRMPILFHAGIVYPAPPRRFGVSSARMDPMYLETATAENIHKEADYGRLVKVPTSIVSKHEP